MLIWGYLCTIRPWNTSAFCECRRRGYVWDVGLSMTVQRPEWALYYVIFPLQLKNWDLNGKWGVIAWRGVGMWPTMREGSNVTPYHQGCVSYVSATTQCPGKGKGHQEWRTSRRTNLPVSEPCRGELWGYSQTCTVPQSATPAVITLLCTALI